MQTPQKTLKQLTRMIANDYNAVLELGSEVAQGREDDKNWLNERAEARHNETRKTIYISFGILALSLFARAGADAYAAHKYEKPATVITLHDQPGCDATPDGDGPVGMSYRMPSAKPMSPKI